MYQTLCSIFLPLFGHAPSFFSNEDAAARTSLNIGCTHGEGTLILSSLFPIPLIATACGVSTGGDNAAFGIKAKPGIIPENEDLILTPLRMQI